MAFVKGFFKIPGFHGFCPGSFYWGGQPLILSRDFIPIICIEVKFLKVGKWWDKKKGAMNRTPTIKVRISIVKLIS